MGKKHFCFFQTAETGNRTPNSGVKGSGANHYPKAPAHRIKNNGKCVCCNVHPDSWEFLLDRKAMVQDYLSEAGGQEGRVLVDLDWICSNCKGTVNEWNKQKIKKARKLQTSTEVTDLIIKLASNASRTITECGYKSKQEFISEFKQHLPPDMDNSSIAQQVKQFEYYLHELTQCRECTFSR